MEYRKLEVSDWEQYKELRLLSLVQSSESFENSFEDESTLRNEQWIGRVTATQSAFIIGAFDGDVLIGVAGFAQALKDKIKHKSYLWGVFVKQEYRGQYIANDMLSKLVHIAFQHTDISQIQLTVTAENEAAIALYKKLGFRKYGTEVDALRVSGKSYDEILMAYVVDET
ncbi:GNAT family N-acetyltransferase [Parasalinivibrio latis]|uniref:GNAT family N-acetyltransferase n=1 Tax=Parasalinivibrio latis TaxID=2952610 RepID=UPI003DA656A3